MEDHSPTPKGTPPSRSFPDLGWVPEDLDTSRGGGRGGTSIRAANRTRRPRTGDMYSARNAIAPRNAGLCATGRCIRRNTRKTAVRVVAHEDDDVLPILRLPKKETDVPNPTTKEQRGTVGATTVGEELARIHGQMKNRDTSVKDRMEAELNTPNWDGDVYIGSNWNVGTALLLVFVVTMVGIGVFAYLTYGTVWGTTPDVQF